MPNFKEPDFTMEHVLNYLNMSFSGGTVNPKVVCPVCGKKDYFFNRNKNNGKCFKCDFKGNQVSYLAKTLGVDNKEARKLMASYMGTGKGSEYVPNHDFVEPIKNAPSNISDCIYREMIKESPLTTPAVRNLMERGLTAEEIAKSGYGYYERANANRIIKETGVSPKGVAGFYDDGEWKATKVKGGIAVPYLNEKREICGIQIRKLGALREGESKYTWLTSNGKPNGAKVAPCCHFATDWAYDTSANCYKPLLRGRSVFLTEGAMKADIAHAVTGQTILAIAGVSNLGSLERALDYVKAQGIVSIVDVLDMDYLTNPNVQRAMNNIKKIILAHDLQYTRYNWNTSPEPNLNLKGYDDFCVYMRSVGRVKKRG